MVMCCGVEENFFEKECVVVLKKKEKVVLAKKY